MIKVKRALISVSDKNGIEEFARFLTEQGIEIISTGGTLKVLQSNNIPVVPVEEYTGFPEMMEGRLKTLHPKIHGGLLALRDRSEHLEAMQTHKIGGIDLLVVNLYPFAATVSQEDVTLEKAIENIDIGGPTMLRAAAKNYRFTASLCEPSDYSRVIEAISAGGISEELSFELARRVFNHTAAYDALIAGYLNEQSGQLMPEKLTLTFEKEQSLRYGENPHQQAASYRPAGELAREKLKKMSSAEQLQGKELSFNNLLDFSSALESALFLPRPGVVIIKHLNPCGAAVSNSNNLLEAFLAARECDPVSAFGGVIGVAGVVDEKLAATICENFTEGVIALDFTSPALKVFEAKKNLRLLKVHDPERFKSSGMEIRQIYNGILYQELDKINTLPTEWQCVTEERPDSSMLGAMEFAWRLVRHVKSNAIVFCDATRSLGIGAGQMSRIDSVDIAVMKAKKNNLELNGSVVASDAFFPFRDTVDAIAATGVRAIVQPGGSVRDEEVIGACNEHGITMMFTGHRHFRH